MSTATLREGLSGAFRALRGFLRGFAGLPAPHLHAEGCRDATAARKALAERSERRRSCC